MSIAIMSIGIPGSGKTTALKPFAERHTLTYINRDDIREELLGDASDQSRNKMVWEEANRRTAETLSLGRGVVLDATFVEPWKRKQMITFLRESGATSIIGIYADVPFEVAKGRNAGRERIVSDDVLEWMQDLITKNPPHVDEGFDSLCTLEELPELERTLFP